MAKKLIEVALPMPEINLASAQDMNSNPKGHLKGLHKWWARRPLPGVRAVILSSLLTDPADPDYPWGNAEKRDVEQERRKLHSLISRVCWIGLNRTGKHSHAESNEFNRLTDEDALSLAKQYIRLHVGAQPPTVLDPFAGRGVIPFEASRLGLDAHASDLNPVAVLINKALIEIPQKFTAMPPVNPDQQNQVKVAWRGTAGLATDVRYYGNWMRHEAERRIGHLYPRANLPKEHGGGEATVVAWLWARTAPCPNPACGAEMPLITSYWLSRKSGRETWIEPVVRGQQVSFEIRQGPGEPMNPPKQGRGAKFACIVCGHVSPDKHVKKVGQSSGLGHKLIAIVAESEGRRIYLPPSEMHERVAVEAVSSWRLNHDLPNDPRNFWTPSYGLTTFGSLFTQRQLLALAALSDAVGDVRKRVEADASAAGLPMDRCSLADGGTGATSYGDAVASYLAFAVDKYADYGSSLVSWRSDTEAIKETFNKQAIPMVWDYAEINPLIHKAGTIAAAVNTVADVLEYGLVEIESRASATQADAAQVKLHSKLMISTDPPYYDNIAYADLSDFFYLLLRRSIGDIWPKLFQSLAVPKQEELVATPYRFSGGRREADKHFEGGLQAAFRNFAELQCKDFPFTVWYAFKQAETEVRGDGAEGRASTGWETMLEGLVRSGFQVTATWPVSSEMSTRVIGQGTNSLASSVVLACRVRPDSASETTRQQFLREMRTKLGEDLKPLQQANIAPVDLAQAAIGPGMAIYSKYSRVREASGDSLRVREALALINQVLFEVLAEQDEEYDPGTRWAITWYEQFGMNDGPFDEADKLARARNVSVDAMSGDGMVLSGRGKVRFVWREELPEITTSWQPRSRDVTDWVIMQRLAHAVQTGQRDAAEIKARIDAVLPGRTEFARDLAYRAFNIAELKGWTREALVYNTLVQNWSDLEHIADEISLPNAERQAGFDL